MTSQAFGTLPNYVELPYNDALRGRISWGVFGADDELGCIGLIGPDCVAAASAEIQHGTYFNLSLPLDEPNPPPGGRKPFEHHIYWSHRNDQDDWLDGFYLQTTTQWDGLRHVGAREFGFYNGVSTEAASSPKGALGIHNWANHGIVTRGVLADVHRYCEQIGEPLPADRFALISPDLLRATLEHQGVQPRTGDVLLVRTGYLGAFLGADSERRLAWDYRQGCPGLAGSEAMAAQLWDWHIAAVCADTPSVEVRPGDPKDGSLHRRAIPMLGLALGELFDLDALAAHCAADGRYTFFFAGVPLNLPGGVGSPANAFAIK